MNEVITPIGKMTINGDGTVTDHKNKLMWLQAPIGCEFKNGFWSGNSKKMSFYNASKLYGRGVDCFGWVKPEEHRMAWFKPDLLKESDISNGYTYGLEKYTFAEYSDWRLPTAIECHKTLCFGISMQDKWINHDGSTEYLRDEIFKKIFWMSSYENIWTSNGRDISFNKDWKYKAFKFFNQHDSGVAFKFLHEKIGDDSSNIEYSVILVRNL